jgi:hypothetical protein
MEAWEDPASRVDNLVLMGSRAEVEAGNIKHASAMLQKLLTPENASRLKGRLIFGIRGYDDDPRELFEVPEVRTWMEELDREFPYWFYFMDLGSRSTLSLVAFCLCRWEKVPGGKMIPLGDLQVFVVNHFVAMNRLAASLGETQEEVDRRSREITAFFFLELQTHDRRGS